MKKVSICHITIADRNMIARLRRETITTSKMGWENTIICVGEEESNQYFRFFGVRKAKNRIDRIFKVSRMVYLKAKSIDADIYQIHDPELLRFAVELKKSGKKVVFDSHENYMRTISDRKWIPARIRKIIEYFYHRFIARVLPKLDGVLAVNRQIAESLDCFNNRIIVVSNFPTLREKPQTSNKFGNDFTVCYTGGISNQWSLNEIISAVADLENVKFVVCGAEWEAGFVDKLKLNKGSDKTDFLGILSPTEALSVQESSCVGIAALKYSNNTNGKEGTMGNTKLFEYFMAGLPVICTDFDCWKDIIEEYQCGICVNPYSIDEIRNAILIYKNNPTLAISAGANARKAAEEKYNWEKEEVKLIDFYNHIVDSGR